MVRVQGLGGLVKVSLSQFFHSFVYVLGGLEIGDLHLQLFLAYVIGMGFGSFGKTSLCFGGLSWQLSLSSSSLDF
jgi:hypothetical protein